MVNGKIFLAVIVVTLCHFSTTVLATSCGSTSTIETQIAVTRFKGRPIGLLEQFPAGEARLSSALALIVSADPDGTQGLVFALLRKANAYQKRAIGLGLGLATVSCRRNLQSDMAGRISAEFQKINEPEASRAFFNISSPNASTERSVYARTIETQNERKLIGRSAVSSPDTNVFTSQGIFDPWKRY